jgi:hypothetical protein
MRSRPKPTQFVVFFGPVPDLSNRCRNAGAQLSYECTPSEGAALIAKSKLFDKGIPYVGTASRENLNSNKLREGGRGSNNTTTVCLLLQKYSTLFKLNKRIYITGSFVL